MSKKVVSKAKKAVNKKPVKKTAKKMQPKAVKKPVKVVAKKPVAKKVVKAAVAKKVVASKVIAAKPAIKAVAPQRPVVAPAKVFTKPAIQPSAKATYKVGCHVVYPTHGVGKIISEETQKIGDIELKMLVIAFEKDKMTLRVPVHRASAAGLRPISSGDQMKKMFETLRSKAKVSRGMWSRRAQEYEAKINSGSVLSVAEVVRDLHQNVDLSERSYSERMIYESALARLVGELAAAEGTDHKAATDKLMKLLRAKAAANIAAAKEAA
ncbi:MAG: CarD family transcriptional regulator [Alphaproteobacteria bacterium]